MLEADYEFPEGVDASFEGGSLIVKGPKGEIARRMVFPTIDVKLNGNKLEMASKRENKKVKAVMYTWKAIADTMSVGVTKGWKTNLRLVYSHFPVKLKQEGKELIVENFLGEREKRKIVIPEDVKLEIKGNDLTVTGIDKEKVGQTAALIEQKVSVKKFDRRTFQDGIYKLGKTVPEEGE